MKKGIKDRIEDIFGFSKSETNGFFILLLISFASLMVWFFSPMLVGQNTEIEVGDKARLDSLSELLQADSFSNSKSHFLFSFNPNTLSVDSLQYLGIELTVAQRFENYRSKGGRFRYKEQLKKIYGFDDSTYLKLKNYVELPDSVNYFQQVKAVRYDVNTVRFDQLKEISGIGTVLAQRIIRYRELLGGYISEDQFNEIYDMNELTIDILKKHTFISSRFSPKRLNLNTIDKEKLMKHPYINDILAGDIVQYREINGKFKDLEILKNFKSLDKNGFEKLFPYLEF